MERYIKTEWPESQLFQGEEYSDSCYQCDDQVIFVPEDIYFKVMR